MSSYDLSNLNSKDFEELAADLLSRELSTNKESISFKTYKDGKDGGIDLRYSTATNDNEIIVQVKHYLKTDIRALIRGLKNTELPKVKKLNPNRYIVFTSCEMSPQNEEEVKEIFEPYIKSLADIFHKNSVLALLFKHEDIANQHIKLWLTSYQALEKIFSSKLIDRSAFYLEEKVKAISKTFYQTEYFLRAKNYLQGDRVVILKGEPGAGKTTIAQMLVYLYSVTRNYKFLIPYDAYEVEAALSPNPDQKTIILLDDIFGQNYLEKIENRNEKALEILIQRVKMNRNLSLIITTRSAILTRATEKSAKIKRALDGIPEIEVSPIEYSAIAKAHILYNQLLESELSLKAKLDLCELEKFEKIIEHKNFNPRVIATGLDSKLIKIKSGANFFDAFIRHLENPADTWSHYFHEGIGEAERLLILSLFSLGNEADTHLLRRVFKLRVKYEAQYGFQSSQNSFNKSLNMLMGEILEEIPSPKTNTSLVKFKNPSFVDFLLKYINDESTEEREKLIESIACYEQTKRFTKDSKYVTGILLSPQESEMFVNHILTNLNDIIQNTNEKSDDLIKLLIVSDLIHMLVQSERYSLEVLQMILSILCSVKPFQSPDLGYYKILIDFRHWYELSLKIYLFPSVQNVLIEEKKAIITVLIWSLMYDERGMSGHIELEPSLDKIVNINLANENEIVDFFNLYGDYLSEEFSIYNEKQPEGHIPKWARRPEIYAYEAIHNLAMKFNISLEELAIEKDFIPDLQNYYTRFIGSIDANDVRTLTKQNWEHDLANRKKISTQFLDIFGHHFPPYDFDSEKYDSWVAAQKSRTDESKPEWNTHKKKENDLAKDYDPGKYRNFSSNSDKSDEKGRLKNQIIPDLLINLKIDLMNKSE